MGDRLVLNDIPLVDVTIKPPNGIGWCRDIHQTLLFDTGDKYHIMSMIATDGFVVGVTNRDGSITSLGGNSVYLGESEFALLPSAVESPGNFIFVTDVGVNGCLMKSDGIKWSMLSPAIIYQHTAWPALANVPNETVTFPSNDIIIPGGLLREGSKFRISGYAYRPDASIQYDFNVIAALNKSDPSGYTILCSLFHIEPINTADGVEIYFSFEGIIMENNYVRGLMTRGVNYNPGSGTANITSFFRSNWGLEDTIESDLYVGFYSESTGASLQISSFNLAVDH